MSTETGEQHASSKSKPAATYVDVLPGRAIGSFWLGMEFGTAHGQGIPLEAQAYPDVTFLRGSGFTLNVVRGRVERIELALSDEQVARVGSFEVKSTTPLEAIQKALIRCGAIQVNEGGKLLECEEGNVTFGLGTGGHGLDVRVVAPRAFDLCGAKRLDPKEEPLLADSNRKPLVPLHEHFSSKPTRQDVIEVVLARANRPLPKHASCPHGEFEPTTLGQYLARQLMYLHGSECHPGIRVVVEDNGDGKWMCELMAYHDLGGAGGYSYGIRFFVDSKTGRVDDGSFWCPGTP